MKISFQNTSWGKKLKHLTVSSVGKDRKQREFIYTAGGSINRNSTLEHNLALSSKVIEIYILNPSNSN